MEEFGLKKFRVLVVDDTHDIHTDVRKILSWGPIPQTDLQRLEVSLFEIEEKFQPTISLPRLRIDSAYQGAEAIEMVQKGLDEADPYHLIFMDVRMPPGMDGIEAVQKIWQIQPDAHILICTAYSDYKMEEIITKLGISDQILYLTKPFTPTVLMQSAITLLKKWDLDHQLKLHAADLENLVTQQTAMLLQSSKMAALGEMAGGLAHEVNTPLTVMKLAIRQIEDIPPEKFARDSTKQSVDTISRMVERIAKIISALRSISRTSEGDPFESVSLVKIIDDVKALCSERFSRANIELQTNQVPNLSIECRPVDISQVLLNLLNNAFDAVVGLPEKWIRLEIVESHPNVRIRISDSGPGIPTAIAERIFDPFFTTKEVGKGTGLGLSVSKGLIESHKGLLYVDPRAKSTSFIIELPKVQPT